MAKTLAKATGPAGPEARGKRSPFPKFMDLIGHDPNIDIARAGFRWSLHRGFRNMIGSYTFVYNGKNGKGAKLSIAKGDDVATDIVIGDGQSKSLTLCGGKDVVDLKVLDHTNLSALVSISINEGAGRS